MNKQSVPLTQVVNFFLYFSEKYCAQHTYHILKVGPSITHTRLDQWKGEEYVSVNIAGLMFIKAETKEGKRYNNDMMMKSETARYT